MGGPTHFHSLANPFKDQTIGEHLAATQKGLTRKKLFRPNGYQLINFYKMTLERQISAEVGGPKR